MDAWSQAIRVATFREKLRGYNPTDVDEFLERVALGVELLEERLAQANERALRAERELEGGHPGDDAVRRTLVLAERTAEVAVQEAREQAAELEATARNQARGIVAEARERARRLAEEAQAQLRADVGRLEVAREQLSKDVAALERFLADERLRAQKALADAAEHIRDLMPGPRAAPLLHDVDPVPVPAPPEPDADDPFAEVRRAVQADAAGNGATTTG